MFFKWTSTHHSTVPPYSYSRDANNVSLAGPIHANDDDIPKMILKLLMSWHDPILQLLNDIIHNPSCTWCFPHHPVLQYLILHASYDPILQFYKQCALHMILCYSCLQSLLHDPILQLLTKSHAWSYSTVANNGSLTWHYF